MSGFAALQDAFQRAILDGDDAVLDDILDGPHERREVLFDVYRNAYGLRLVEILQRDYAALAAYLGAAAFDAAARAYMAQNPSRHRSARWVGRALPAYLAAAAPYAAAPELAELAGLECALNDAFDAADAPPLAFADLAAVPPEAWEALRFTPHPSALRLDMTTNASAIWSALADGEAPPEATALAAPERLIVWRAEVTPLVRPMPDEEAMMWDEAGRGVPFGVLCAMVATRDDPATAPARAAGWLQGWIAAGLLAGVAR